MKIKVLMLIMFSANVTLLFAQKFDVKGTVKDPSTNEVLIGANVQYAVGMGASTDLNGNYTMQLDAGNYELTVSYVGYVMQKQKITISKNMRLDFSLQPATMKEVEVTADIAKIRETPVAYTNISAAKINEELGSRDLVMVLNTTPGVYATETGGGAGDARINIRGFDQRNIAVLVDGVPVNDLESGAVFWSNWAGISDILRLTQVQRGLGASKLAVASVGGTMNMITKGIESKSMFSIKQEVGNDNMYKTSLGINSGYLKGGWGITVAGTRTKGYGFADETWDDAYSYFAKVQKQLGKHLISLSASGAPQKHGQRSNRLNAAVYDSSYARSIGVDADVILKNSVYKTIGPRGVRYNDNWGPLDRFELDNGDTIHHYENLNYRVNHFFKPVYNLTDYWTVNQKLFISNVLYLSTGTGGGTGPLGSIGVNANTGQVDFDTIYKTNIKFIDATYSTTEHKSTNTIVDSHNNHLWYGLLSTLNYDINKSFSFTGGIDLRGYKGTHYQTIYDYIGGDYVIDSKNNNQPKATFANDPNYQLQMKRSGDHIGYDYYSHVKWGGVFSQLEYKKNKWSSFITLSGSETGYQRFDYFQKRDVVAEGRTFNNIIAWGDTLLYNGTDYFINTNFHRDSVAGNTTYVISTYGSTKGQVVAAIENANQYYTNSSESRISTTKEKWYPGYVVKAGANYNINEHHNVFINGGHLQIAPRFTSVFDFNNRAYTDTKAQLVDAVEGGYSFHSKKFAANLNGFYTYWKNKPYTKSGPDPKTGLTVNYNINGVNELHKGVEVDLLFKIMRQLTAEGTLSIGDWRYKSGGIVSGYSENGDSVGSIEFSARNVHVGDAAQTQYAVSLRYEPIQGLYIKGQFIYFERYYADFDPTILNGSNADRDSWKLPSYNTEDIFAGYNFRYWKINFNITAGVFNVFNNLYITDARGNGGFDANSATVFISQGRRFNTSLKLTF